MRAHRTARGWSQQALASKADLSLRTLVSLEGGANCSLTTLRKLADAFALPVVVLVGGEDGLREIHGLCSECEVPTFGPCKHREAVAS